MWDYSYAIPSILILSILFFYYFSLKRIPIRINRCFIELLWTESVVIGSDIVSSFSCENYLWLPHWWVVFVNMAYFLSLVIRIRMFYNICCVVLSIDPYENKLRTFIKDIPLLTAEIIILSSVYTGAVFSITDAGYVKGPWYNVIYLCYSFYLALSFYDIKKYRPRIKRRREFNCLLIYNSSIIIGLILRYAFPRVLIFDTFCIMAIIIINLAFLNPDFYIDKRSNNFNSEAFRAILAEKHKIKDHYFMAFTIKNYNEAREIYGPSQMDEGIWLIGEYLNSHYRGIMKFYYRSGRFILVGRDMDKLNTAKEGLLERFKEPWASDNAELYLEIGVATSSIDVVQYDTSVLLSTISGTLWKLASSPSLYEIEIDDKIIKESEKLIEVKRCVEEALDKKKTEIFLQPIMEAGTRKLVGAEALCRIRDEAGNVISPGLFIPVAERNGHITLLGEQVFENTCKIIKERKLQDYGIDWVSVNVSTIQFMQRNLASQFEKIIRKYELEPQYIRLEVTEAAMVDEYLMTRQILNLHKKGFFMVVDDYGTGYSNISRLKKYPFINVKLDMSLVWDYMKKPGVIVPKMVEAFKETGYTLTAEGIETEEIAQAMEACGVDYLQGMYFAAPLPIDEFIDYVQKRT